MAGDGMQEQTLEMFWLLETPVCIHGTFRSSRLSSILSYHILLTAWFSQLTSTVRVLIESPVGILTVTHVGT
jgi:hypothetical protein